MQNANVESFNGRKRDEMVNQSLFLGRDYARSAIAEWADDYNNFRPHSSLGIRPRQAMPIPLPQPAPTLREMKASRFRHLAYSKRAGSSCELSGGCPFGPGRES